MTNVELYALQDPQREVGPGAKAANLTAHYVIMPFVIASHRSVTFLELAVANDSPWSQACDEDPKAIKDNRREDCMQL